MTHKYEEIVLYDTSSPTEFFREGASLYFLHYSLRHHCIGDLEKACDVRADNEVVLVSVFLCGVCHVVIDIYHNVVELVIDLFKRPADARAVLAHLKRGGRDAARVCRLAGGKEDFVLQENFGSFRSRGHVRTLADRDASVLYQLFCVLGSELVLRGARQSYVAGYAPDFFALVKFRVRALFDIFAYPCAADFFYLLERRNVDAVRVIDESARIAGAGFIYRREWINLSNT